MRLETREDGFWSCIVGVRALDVLSWCLKGSMVSRSGGCSSAFV
jgi:hypothetical protein